MPSILFVCTANQFRSPLAAASLVKSLEGELPDQQWVVESAGTWAESGLPAPDITLKVGARLGLNRLNAHRTRQIDQNILDQYDLIIVMEMGHKEAISSEFPFTRSRLHLLSEIVDEVPYDIPDPAYQNVNPYDVGRDLQNMIRRGMGKILRLAQMSDKS